MKVCNDLMKLLLKSYRAALPADFTGKTTLTINWHGGAPKVAVVAIEEGQKIVE